MTDDLPPTVQAPDPNPYANPKNPNNLIERVQAILLKPNETWDVIEGERPSVQSLYTSYIMPLAAIGPVANLIGSVIFGTGIPGLFSYRPSILMAVSSAVVYYVLALVLIYVVALIIDGLAPSFNGRKDFISALKLAAYASTAAWVAAIFGLLPALSAIALLGGLYSIYLFYLGLPKLMKNPPDKTIVYMIVVAVIYIVLAAVIGGVATGITRMGMVGHGLYGGLGGSHVSGTVNVPGAGSVDLAKAEAAVNQMAAQASAIQAGTATPVKMADAAGLLALMPQNFNGAMMSDTQTSSGGAGGVSISSAQATYAVGGGTIRLEVTDMGTLAGVGAMATALNINTSESSAGGYEKVTTQNGRVVSETWQNDSHSGKYSVVDGGRFSVAAEGSDVDMATLKSIVAQVDLGRAQALAR